MFSTKNYLFAIFVCAALFILFPSLDIKISAVFYDESGGFLARDSTLLQSTRHGIWALTVFVFLLSCICAVIFMVTKDRSEPFEVSALAYILGPGILVNGVFKEYSGRARPYRIEEFGGSKDFSAAFQIADQCATNCSFTSGEAAGSAAMFFTVALILKASNLAGIKYVVLYTTVAIIAVIGMILRLVMGGHFASDILLSYCFVGLCFSLCLQLKRYKPILNS